ncbi:MAG: hypothetical protein JXA90_09085 [Planctomycetes bacterium]|nr:hypothetical protein [Planctomycetota bacterium]
MKNAPDPLHHCRPNGSCPTCNPPDEEAPLCADCGLYPATEPVNRHSRKPRYCRACDQARREEAEEAMAEARRDERFEYSRPEYDEDPS